jgi:hypothetical protein
VERLAAATAEVDVPLIAALARLGHPPFAAEPFERLGAVPRALE